MSSQDFTTLQDVGYEPKIRSIFDFTDEALQQVRLWLEMHPPATPISSVLGFSNFTAHHAEVTTKQAIAAPINTFNDLATVGPELTQIPAGKYVLIFGCAYDASGGATGVMACSINGSTPATSDGAVIEPTAVQRFNMMRAVVADLSLDSNTIRCKYYCTQVGPMFYVRWLIALKYDNI